MQVRRKYRRLKRFAYLGLVTGTIVAVRRARTSRRPQPLGPPASWPPLERADEPPVAAMGNLATALEPEAGTPEPSARVGLASDPAAPERAADQGDPPVRWVPALADGSCPLSHPVKANANSRIFHEPGGRFYERTQAERCYVDAVAAAADGYRAAKGAFGPNGSVGPAASTGREER